MNKENTYLSENKTSHDHPLYSKSCSRYPYIGKVSVGEEDRLDFVYQFAKKKFVDKTLKNNLSTVFSDMLGPPIKFPDYDFPETRACVCGISISPWQNEKYLEQEEEFVKKYFEVERSRKFTYIDIEFHEAVYPIRISIYEGYNPGSVIKIWAQDSDDDKCWSLLWDGLPQFRQHYSNCVKIPLTPRLFSPPLQSCNFKTKMLRLECINFYFSITRHYYTKIDAVMLIGTSEMILPKNFKESLTNLLKRINCVYSCGEDNDNLTANYKNAHLDIIHLQKNFPEYCIICKSDIKKEKTLYKSDFKKSFLACSNVSQASILAIPGYFTHFKLRNSHVLLENYSSCAKYIELSSDKSKELSKEHCLSSLCDEIIFKILKNLDFTSLCYMNQVNKRFNNLTRDPYLYTRLNILYLKISDINFCYFASRCKYLQQLDLTKSSFSDTDFVKFLDNCSSHLTHLRLRSCFISDLVLLKISEMCKSLKELDISNRRNRNKKDDKGYSYLENLESLEHLNLSNTPIKTRTLCKILRKTQRMRKLNLKCASKINVDTVARELKNSCRDLEVINLDSIYDFTTQGINDLADCKNLRKVDFNRFEDIDDTFYYDSFCKLFSSCQYLEELHLSLTSDRILMSLEQCKNLEQLHLYYIKLFLLSNKNIYSFILEHCPKLQKFYLICCDITDCMVNEWKERYPHVSVYIFR